MSQDKMPQMGEHVEVGLTPVEETRYRLESDSVMGSHIRQYIVESVLCSTVYDIITDPEFKKLVVEKMLTKVDTTKEKV